jgi:flagellar biosynthesis protein FlhA
MSISTRDLTVLLGVIMIVFMLVIPLPAIMLDFLIIINILIALMILLFVMNATEALEFSVFPTLLLIVTLFRLALNVSTTRAILSNGNGGEGIEAFGDFVVGGNALVGFAVFLILVLIQFLVITKGSARVSEVSARFTLDAMPEKQMAIDADLNSGMIDELQARTRRQKIQSEADFYGAMDGASKFVKGDAIAGIIIVIIKLIFGMIIGVVQQGLPIADSVKLYTLMTVGDGLVSQIPALLISVATGIIVTRSTSDGNLGEDVIGQLARTPLLVGIAAGGILLLGLFTAILDNVTMPIAILFGFFAWRMKQTTKTMHEEVAVDEAPSENIRSSESVISLLNVDTNEFEFGYGLIPLADEAQGGVLLDRVVMIRRQLSLELGFVLPTVRIRDHLQLSPNQYRIKIRGSEMASGELLLDHYLAMSPGVDDPEIRDI